MWIPQRGFQHHHCAETCIEQDVCENPLHWRLRMTPALRAVWAFLMILIRALLCGVGRRSVMGTCSNTRVVPMAGGHGVGEEAISPCASWQGPNFSVKPAAPDRSMHERHVKVLEEFMTAVEHEPVALEKTVLKRRKRAMQADILRQSKRPDETKLPMPPMPSLPHRPEDEGESVLAGL
ncbi:unnamed protein product [Effrenium voratum]|nr:unnamed protein product [Effrenium voratum]